MNFVANTLKKIKNTPLKYKDGREETFIKQGREQFKKLIEKGLGVPVALL